MESAVHFLCDVVIAIFAQKQGVDFARLFDVIEVEFFLRDIVILHPCVEVCVCVSGFEIRVISVVGHLQINLAVLESRKVVEYFGFFFELGFENIKSAGVKDNPLRIQRFEYLPIDRFLITLKSFAIFANIFVQNVSDF